MIGIPLRDLGAMTLGDMSDACAAYNAAHAEESGPTLSDAEEKELAEWMGIA